MRPARTASLKPRSADSAEYVVNIQGDERATIDPSAIDALILSFLGDSELPMGTLKYRIEMPDEVDNPNVVKVVTDHYGNAFYFSRGVRFLTFAKKRNGSGPRTCKHIGLYIYQREFLLGYSSLWIQQQGPL